MSSRKSNDVIQARVASYYSPRAEEIKRDLRYFERDRYDNEFSTKYVHDPKSIAVRSLVNQYLNDSCPILKSSTGTIVAIIRAAFDKDNWTKFEEESAKMGRPRAIRKFCKRMAAVAGNTALSEVIYQLMRDSLETCLEMGGLSSALIATAAVNGVFIVVKAIRARGGIPFGKCVDTLRSDLGNTGAAAAFVETWSEDGDLSVILAGVVIAVSLGTILPEVYPKMARAMTFKEFVIGALEAIGLKTVPPRKEYVMNEELETLLREKANDLFCPISFSLMRNPVSIHGQVFEYDEIEKFILERGEDCYNLPATVRELQVVPELKALIHEMVEEFDIDLE